MWTPMTRCPMQAALALRDAIGIKMFVETGTAQGDTSFIAAGHFRSVITIEIEPEAFKLAGRHLGKCHNVLQMMGDSAILMPEVLAMIECDEPILFWLDGHYSGGPTKVGKSECPVIDEIKAIRASGQKHVIFIDDMQIFCTSGAEREKAMQGWSVRPGDWPSADEIVKALDGYFCMIKQTSHAACLMAVPPEFEQVLKENLG